jgi:hypothetical protein
MLSDMVAKHAASDQAVHLCVCYLEHRPVSQRRCPGHQAVNNITPDEHKHIIRVKRRHHRRADVAGDGPEEGRRGVRSAPAECYRSCLLMRFAYSCVLACLFMSFAYSCVLHSKISNSTSAALHPVGPFKHFGPFHSTHIHIESLCISRSTFKFFGWIIS